MYGRAGNFRRYTPRCFVPAPISTSVYITNCKHACRQDSRQKPWNSVLGVCGAAHKEGLKRLAGRLTLTVTVASSHLNAPPAAELAPMDNTNRDGERRTVAGVVEHRKGQTHVKKKQKGTNKTLMEGYRCPTPCWLDFLDGTTSLR